MPNLSASKSLYVFFLRYSPTVGAFAFMVHYSLLFLGVHSLMPDYIFDTSLLAFLFLWVSSKVFGFCRLHRAFIVYIALASFDVDLHKWVELPHSLLIPSAMLIYGAVLFFLLARRNIEKGRP